MEMHSANFLPETLKLIEDWHATELKIEELLIREEISIAQIPEILLTTRHAIISVLKNPLIYLKLPFKVRSNELGLLACQVDHKLAKMLPVHSMSWINSHLPTPILEVFPEQHRHELLCEFAMEKNQKNIQFVPVQMFRNRDYIEDIVSKYPNSLLYIDQDYIDEELCDLALLSDSFELKFVPSKYRTEELCRTAFKKNHTSFYDLPIEFIREEDFFSVVERCEASEIPKIVKMLTKEMSSSELWKEICKKDSLYLNLLPSEYMTEFFIFDIAPYIRKASHIKKIVPEHIRANDEIKMRLIESNPLLLEAIPEKDRDQFLCQRAVQANGMALQYVPMAWADVDMNIMALQQNGLSLKYIPQPYRDMAYPKLAVSQNGEAIEYVPLQYQSEEICRIAVNQNAKAIYHINSVKMTSEYCLIAIRKDPSDLSMIPLSYRNHEICKIAFNHSASNYQYIPEHLKTTSDILGIVEYYKGNGIHIDGLNKAEI